jgi:hypothetical protein
VLMLVENLFWRVNLEEHKVESRRNALSAR